MTIHEKKKMDMWSVKKHDFRYASSNYIEQDKPNNLKEISKTIQWNERFAV